MNKKVLFPLIALVAIASMLLAACGPTPAEVCGTPGVWKTEGDNVFCNTDSNPAATEAPVATEAPATEGMCPPGYDDEVIDGKEFCISVPAPAQPTSCELDKIGTWSEISSTSPYRIEVGGHGVQHMDFYPAKDVKSVSYIVATIAPIETPAIWFGYGSDWEGQLSECGNFDFVADATNYAKARLDSGHSGLVVDLRGGEFKVVANVANMSQKDIDALLAQHMAAMDPTK